MMSTKTIKCPIDGRLFATRRALEVHRLAKHGNGVVGPATTGNPARRAGRRNRRQRAGMSIQGVSITGGSPQVAVFSGSDLIGSTNVGSAMKPGTVLLVWDVNPKTIAETRLNEFSQVFGRWRPRRMAITCIPGAGTFTPGSYAMGWVADPSFSLGDVETRLRRVLTMSPNLMSSFGTPRTLSLPTDTTQKWYICRPGHGVESDHGIVVAVLAAKVAAENITINFKLDWTVEFSSPEVPESIEEVEIYPDPDYIPIFTDSVSDWQGGTKLTFKHKSGGSVVPWVGIKPGYVYVPAKEVKIPYAESSTKTDTVKAISVIKDFIYPSGAACHKTVEDAKEYQKTGDISKVITYVEAGDYVTPTFPTMIGQSTESDILVDLRHSVASLKIKPPPLGARAAINFSKASGSSPYVCAGQGPTGSAYFDAKLQKNPIGPVGLIGPGFNQGPKVNFEGYTAGEDFEVL